MSSYNVCLQEGVTENIQIGSSPTYVRQLGVDLFHTISSSYCAGIAKWSKANASRAFLVGVQGFDSLSPHKDSVFRWLSYLLSKPFV